MEKGIQFTKYQGTGNDFILIDSFEKDIQLTAENIRSMCNRQFGIGADGLMILRKKNGYDFDMDFYNSDGNPGSMCGNGGRCIIAFAHDLGIIKDKTFFWAPDGDHIGIFHNHDKISLKMIDVSKIEEHELGLYMNTGSPHLVVFKNVQQEINVFEEGKKIRYSEPYSKQGVNVNFVIPNKDLSTIYTYERGVENQTLSCGTGTVASAIALHKIKNLASPIRFNTLGGKLNVRFEWTNKNEYNNIWLEGPANKVFSGEINL